LVFKRGNIPLTAIGAVILMIWVCKMTMFMTGVTILKEMDDIHLEGRLDFVDTGSSHPMEYGVNRDISGMYII
jgi:hypothetical protein